MVHKEASFTLGAVAAIVVATRADSSRPATLAGIAFSLRSPVYDALAGKQPRNPIWQQRSRASGGLPFRAPDFL